ncbi:hypothetical protein [Povalibacter sp.]|uniref:hypothetical protein n=1 Tax=Povalibacter sp. TaxID=1962978 RepID=UPI002F410754
MQATVRDDVSDLIAAMVKQVDTANGELDARATYRKAFLRLRAHLSLHPRSVSRPSLLFESAAQPARLLAAQCLPLATAVVMHLYPLCALQCVPIPLLSPARLKRALLLRDVHQRSLILANVGGERTQTVDSPLIATATADGIRIDGTCDYMSLASVADVVLCRAELADGRGTVLCAVDLRRDSVRIGPWKFGGSMRLSDTSSVQLVNHHVTRGRYLVVRDRADMQCISAYQRCWFHLFLADIHLARMERLRRDWQLPPASDSIVALNEVGHLRQYSLRLLDDFAPGADIAPLTRCTATLKLRTSLLAQTMMATLRGSKPLNIGEKERLESAAQELGYIRFQPTSDQKILQSLDSTAQNREQRADGARAWTQGMWFDQRSLR